MSRSRQSISLPDKYIVILDLSCKYDKTTYTILLGGNVISAISERDSNLFHNDNAQLQVVKQRFTKC